jgi:selenide,water dikinase
MIEGSDMGIVIHAASVPFFPEIREFVEMGIVPAGLHRNRQFRANMIEVEPACPDWLADILFDPQTAGGLLISLPEPQAETLMKKMHSCGIMDAAIVGEVISEPKGKILVV